MTKLSDTQAILLSTASQRANGSLLPLPTSIAAGIRLAKPLARLLMRGFAEERGTSVADEVHRTDGDERIGLYITLAGAAAIGVAESASASESAPETQSDEPTDTVVAGRASSPRQTKAALVLGLLQQEHGATLAELIAATGWLPHTTRAALTGLRKKGHDVQRGKRGDLTFYRVAVEAR